MPDETRIPITCPVCKHHWSVEMAELKASDQVVYKIVGEQHLESYRVKCPKCGTYVVVDIEVEE